MQQHNRPAAVWVLLFILHAALLTSSQAQRQQQDAACPFDYKRHSLDSFQDAAIRPYLFGGIYNSDRTCVNCQRGGLWSDFCGFKVSGKMKDIPFWSLQLCNGSTIDAIIKRTMQMDNAEDVLAMTPCDLWTYLRGRTTWIIGDSMSKDLFKALKCFMVEFSDLATYHASNNFTAMHYLDSLPGFGEPHCMHMSQHSRICQVHAIQGDLFIKGNRTKVGVLPLLQESLAASHDLFIINFGLWHGETKQPEYQDNLHQLGQFYNSTKKKFPNLFWMETPKQHFDSEDGDYKVPWIGVRKGPFQCQPIKGITFESSGHLTAAQGNSVAEYVRKGSWRNIMARQVLQGRYNVPILPVYNVTATAWDFHRSNFDGQECSHYCHPSVPQLWLYQLKQTLLKYKVLAVTGAQIKELNKRRKPGCATVYERDETKFGAPKPLEMVQQQQQQQQQKRIKKRQHQEQQQQLLQHYIGFWDWMFRLLGFRRQLAELQGMQKVEGVGVAKNNSSTSMEQESYSHSSTLHPWDSLKNVLNHRKGSRQQQQG